MLSAKLLALSMFVVGLCLTSSFGQAKAALQLSDLAGQWELVAARSTMRKGAKYSSGAITISVRGDEVRLKRTLESEESATERDLAFYLR